MKSLTPEPSKSVSAPFLKEHFQTALFETFSQDRQHSHSPSVQGRPQHITVLLEKRSFEVPYASFPVKDLLK